MKIACKIFKCNKSEVLVSSTGIIGEYLKPNKIIKKLNNMPQRTSKGIIEAAKAIMTTDTFPKVELMIVNYKSFKIPIYGFAKGSGMIAPNMGTMLAYIFIEASLDKSILKKLLKKNSQETFNSISVDGDMSTSDTVMLFSTKSIKDSVKIDNNLLKKISNSL